MELDVEVEILATEVDPADIGSNALRLVDSRHAKVDLIGTEVEIWGALQRIADTLGTCGFDVTPRDPGPPTEYDDYIAEHLMPAPDTPIKDLPEVIGRIREYNEHLGQGPRRWYGTDHRIGTNRPMS